MVVRYVVLWLISAKPASQNFISLNSIMHQYASLKEVACWANTKQILDYAFIAMFLVPFLYNITK